MNIGLNIFFRLKKTVLLCLIVIVSGSFCFYLFNVKKNISGRYEFKNEVLKKLTLLVQAEIARWNTNNYVFVTQLDDTLQADYDNCGVGSYYDGYGIESIKHPTSSSYLSAIDLKNSCICLLTKTPALLNSLKFGWLSQEEIPNKLAIYGVKSATGGVEHKELIGEFNPNTTYTNDRYLFTTLYFSDIQKYHRFEIKLLEGGKQSRLLLRTLQPSFVKDDDSNSIHFDDCGVGQYYTGYGINALKKKTLNGYLSAYNLASSAVCFSNKKKPQLPLKEIRFFWYSKAEVPKKIALYAINYKKGQETKIALGDYQINSYKELNGYLYSDIQINAPQVSQKYMIKLLEGGTQNRLLVRSIEPIFQVEFSSLNSYLLTLADNISKKLPYGSGVGKRPTPNCTANEIERLILSAKTAHCGNYTYLFAKSLDSSYKWVVYGLETLNGHAHHSLIEVTKDKETQTVDPTLGIIYPCSIAQLINSSCHDYSGKYLTPPNKALNNYLGFKFFYGAKIVSTHENMMKLTHTYCK